MNILEILKSIFKNNCPEKDILIEDLQNQLDDMDEEIIELQKKLLEQNEEESEWEEYWNNKYPKKNVYYKRVEKDGTYEIDVRNYFQINDSQTPTVEGKTNDEKALNGLKLVHKLIKYVADKTEYGYEEFWAYPYQTLKRGHGDCEDMHILLANVLQKSKVPYWKLRLVAGDTPTGGHCYLVYLLDDNSKWVTLDVCYYYNTLPVAQRPDYKDDKLYGSVWFSWNSLYAFRAATYTTSVISDKVLSKIRIKDAAKETD